MLIAMASSKAQALKLYTWQAFENSSTTFIIPVRPQQLPTEAAKAYVDGLMQDPALRALFGENDLSHLKFHNLKPLSDSDFSERALVIANRSHDLSPGDWRMDSFNRLFEMTSTKNYIVPLAADIGLTAEESNRFVSLLDKHFLSFVAMGGDDVDVTPWGQENYDSSRTNARRDRFERKLIEKKLKSIHGKKRKDRLLGICRGAQFIARVMGYKIGRHIPDDFKESQVYHGGACPKPSNPKTELLCSSSFMEN